MTTAELIKLPGTRVKLIDSCTGIANGHEATVEIADYRDAMGYADDVFTLVVTTQGRTIERHMSMAECRRLFDKARANMTQA